MLSAQDDSRNSKKKTDARGQRRVSWGMILLGVVLLTCAVLLFLYAWSNQPVRNKIDDNLNNINRTPPGAGTVNSQTTPSGTPSSTRKPVEKTGTPVSKHHGSSRDEISAGRSRPAVSHRSLNNLRPTAYGR
ncbi:MAG TPA: hypothetical protein VGC66_18360 [Pyrinomonadaceae bacterium]|jgi:hypothetical protein